MLCVVALLTSARFTAHQQQVCRRRGIDGVWQELPRREGLTLRRSLQQYVYNLATSPENTQTSYYRWLVVFCIWAHLTRPDLIMQYSSQV